MNDLACPVCGGKRSKVVDSRPNHDGDGRVRLRECLDCDHRFPTLEVYEPQAKRLFSTSAEHY